jgi:ribonuclease HI
VKSLVWTDGSCNANGLRGRGGWAALIEQAGTVREISGSADGTTQHRMELPMAGVTATKGKGKRKSNAHLFRFDRQWR